MELSYEEIKASTDDFSLQHLIGKGSHGRVYRGALERGKRAVAVKKPSEAPRSIGEPPKLDNEIAILLSVRNPNLVNLVGVCCSRNGEEKLLVTEFMPNGSLHSLLHSSPSTPPPSWPRRTLIALQVARAALSLHEAEPPIVHRDIKSANVLFDRRWNARLGDFSLAVRVPAAAPPPPPPPAGTLGYLDPRYTTPEKVGPKNDVFSFGVVLLELFSSTRAMEMGREPASVVAWAVPMIRGGRAADVCDPRVGLEGSKMGRLVGRVLVLAERCVSRKEERRPTMAEVVGELAGVAERLRWPAWRCLRGKASESVRRCIRTWKRRNKKRVTTTTTTTKIVCKDHLIDSGSDDDDDDG